MQKVRQSSSVQNMQIRDSVFRENLCVEITAFAFTTRVLSEIACFHQVSLPA